MPDEMIGGDIGHELVALMKAASAGGELLFVGHDWKIEQKGTIAKPRARVSVAERRSSHHAHVIPAANFGLAMFIDRANVNFRSGYRFVGARHAAWACKKAGSRGSMFHFKVSEVVVLAGVSLLGSDSQVSRKHRAWPLPRYGLRETKLATPDSPEAVEVSVGPSMIWVTWLASVCFGVLLIKRSLRSGVIGKTINLGALPGPLLLSLSR
jgi:hypothetical protein